MLIVADDEHKAGMLEGLTPTSGLNHTAKAQELAEALSDAVWIDRVLGIEYEMDANGNKPEASQAVIDNIRATHFSLSDNLQGKLCASERHQKCDQVKWRVAHTMSVLS